MEVHLLSQLLNVAANFSLSPIVSKLSTQDKNQTLGKALLIKHIQELAKAFHRFISSKRFRLVGGG